MIDDLETYVQREFRVERAPIEEIEQLTQKLVTVFDDSFDEQDESWPYQIVTGRKQAGGSDGETNYSFSTPAMIAYALCLVSGRIRSSSLAPAVTRYRPSDARIEQRRRDQVEGLVNRAMTRLRAESEALHDPANRSDSVVRRLPDPKWIPPVTCSLTFGWDDPFTLNWLIEVLRGDDREEQQAFLATVCTRAIDLVQDVLKTPYDWTQILQVRREEDVEHSFPVLRVLQLRQTLGSLQTAGLLTKRRLGDVAGVREYLYQRIHRHLSESRIPDGNFDAAELVFALEGWVITAPAEPEPAIIEQAFAVLTESQERSSYWHPLRPFKATPQGLVLLPQSVEIANSVLRICAAKVLQPNDYFANAVGLLDSYRRWLMARLFHGTRAAKPFLGWESEYTHRHDRIHLWQTSQVMIFLQHYSAMLREHLARKLLDLARFSPSMVDTNAEATDGWTWKRFEPLSAASKGSPYRVYDRIEADFIDPRETSEGGGLYSMLLYGPPGTGKSTIASELSEKLGYRFLTVTPSDFITSGGEAVEARTKAIFTALAEQTNLVVLFDEIDHLLLDRNSNLYREQGDLFRLLTPGMLTKLNDLAKGRSVIFVIATNYYERIDAAIKRPGRIDARYLVLPPDSAQRAAYLSEKTDLRDRWESIPTNGNAVVNATARFTYTELNELARRVCRRSPGSAGPDLERAILAAIGEAPPMAAAGRYESRLEAAADGIGTVAGAVERPLEEYALLAYLDLEAGLLEEGVKEQLGKAGLDRVVADTKILGKLMKAVGE